MMSRSMATLFAERFDIQIIEAPFRPIPVDFKLVAHSPRAEQQSQYMASGKAALLPV